MKQSVYKKRPVHKKQVHKKSKILKKSQYYRQQQLRYRIFGVVAILVVVLLLLLIRGCSSAKAKSVSSDQVQTEEKLTVTPEPAMDPVSLTISVVGDCTLGTDEEFDYDTSLNAYYDNNGPDYFFANVKKIFEADNLTIANFEGTLTDSEDREDKQFAFKAPASYADILTAGSVEAVNTANNHSHDYGDQSFDDTLSALDAAGIIHFGYDETAVTEVNGIKVGMVGIYELNDHLGREEQLKQNIEKVKKDGAQLIIVIFHWGNEKEEVPDSNQTTLGHLAIDLGADLVCGHHPHVLQGIEEYKGKNIVYSLGNFCFGGNAYPSDMDTMIFQQTFTIDSNGVTMLQISFRVLFHPILDTIITSRHRPVARKQTVSCRRFRNAVPGLEADLRKILKGTIPTKIQKVLTLKIHPKIIRAMRISRILTTKCKIEKSDFRDITYRLQ